MSSSRMDDIKIEYENLRINVRLIRLPLRIWMSGLLQRLLQIRDIFWEIRRTLFIYSSPWKRKDKMAFDRNRGVTVCVFPVISKTRLRWISFPIVRRD